MLYIGAISTIAVVNSKNKDALKHIKMPANTFGELFRLTTFGESHGKAIGGIIDGCPPGLQLDVKAIQNELNRRRPGQSKLTSPRNEADEVSFLSGIFEGKTTGTPLAFVVQNTDQRSKDYGNLQDTFRPSHADYTYQPNMAFAIFVEAAELLPAKPYRASLLAPLPSSFCRNKASHSPLLCRRLALKS